MDKATSSTHLGQNAHEMMETDSDIAGIPGDVNNFHGGRLQNGGREELERKVAFDDAWGRQTIDGR